MNVNEEHAVDGARVLIVEDEPDLLHLLQYNLAREGYVVATADSGEEGLRLARADPPELVLLDLMLPGIARGRTMRRIVCHLLAPQA